MLRPRGSHECSKWDVLLYCPSRLYTRGASTGRTEVDGGGGGNPLYTYHCYNRPRDLGKHETIRNNVLLLRIFEEFCSTVWTEFIILSSDVENVPMDSGLQGSPSPLTGIGSLVTAVGGLIWIQAIYTFQEPNHNIHNATLRSRPSWLLEYNYCESSKGSQQHFIGNRHASLYGSGGESATFVQNHCTTKLQQVS